MCPACLSAVALVCTKTGGLLVLTKGLRQMVKRNRLARAAIDLEMERGKSDDRAIKIDA
jgi:hypothetical protein